MMLGRSGVFLFQVKRILVSLQTPWYINAWSQNNITLTSKLAFRIDSVFREVYYKKYKSLKIGSGNDVGE